MISLKIKAMKRIACLLPLLIVLLFTACSEEPDEIIACGDDQVIIIDRNKSADTNVFITWKWKVNEIADLPGAYQRYMRSTDECKPVDGNKKILIASSSGGVVLADRKTKQSLFYAHVPNAHSAELLPDNRIVVTLSTAEKGNCIQLFDIGTPEKSIWQDSLYSGHGVVWMPRYQRLFALGYDELRSYSLKDWNTDSPGLEPEKKWRLPDNGGHDLNNISDTKLIISTHNSVWVFDIPGEQFHEFELLRGVRDVKSVNYNESTGELVYTKGEISWWTHNIYSRNPDKIFTVPGIDLYKARVISRH